MSVYAIITAIPGITKGGVISGPLILPTIINDLDMSEDADVRDYSTVGFGDFSQSQGSGAARKTQTFSIDILLTEFPNHFAFQAADVDVTEEAIRTILRSRSPFGLVVKDSPPAERVELQYGAAFGNGVTMRSLLRSRKGNTPGAYWYTIGLTEWRNPGQVVSTIAKDGTDLPTTYRIPKGSSTTLSALAKKYYGQSTDWRTILEANAALKPCSEGAQIGSTSPFTHLKKVTSVVIPVRKT